MLLIDFCLFKNKYIIFFLYLNNIHDLKHETHDHEDEPQDRERDSEPGGRLPGGIFLIDEVVVVPGEDERGETGPDAPAEAEHDIDRLDGDGQQRDEADHGGGRDVDDVGVDGADLGAQLEETGETGTGGAEEAGVRHKNVDGNGDTGNGSLSTLARDYIKKIKG